MAQITQLQVEIPALLSVFTLSVGDVAGDWWRLQEECDLGGILFQAISVN